MFAFVKSVMKILFPKLAPLFKIEKLKYIRMNRTAIYRRENILVCKLKEAYSGNEIESNLRLFGKSRI